MSERRREFWIDVADGRCVVFPSDPLREIVHVREVLPGDLGMLNGYEPLVNKLESLEERHAKLVEAVKQAEAQHMGCGGTLKPNEVVSAMRKILRSALEAEVGDE